MVFLLVAGYFWGFQTVMCMEIRHQGRKLPILNLTPQDPPSMAASAAVGTTLSHAGFAFEVPWTDLDHEKSKFIGDIAVFVFRSGRAVSFFGPSATHEDLLSEVEKQFGDQRGVLKQLFGTEATKSNYDFQRTMLGLTPERMKPWMSQREAIRTSMLLTIKAISSVGGETGIFNVKANGWRGFQFDDPAKKPSRTTLELYDAQDHHVEIILAAKTDAGAKITQADINRVLETLKPVDKLTAAETVLQGR